LRLKEKERERVGERDRKREKGELYSAIWKGGHV